MYRSNPDQLDLYDIEFTMPFGGSLKKDNRWVVLASQIDWDLVDEVYRKSFKKNTNGGQEAYSSRVAFASLYIQRKEKYTDRALVEAIAENHYMQYFLGYKEYIDEIPFDPSLLVYFRRRLDDEIMNEIIERSFAKYAAEEEDDNDKNDGGIGGGSDNDDESGEGESDEIKNKGTLIIDATCAPADIAYPTDLELSDKARRWTERIIDHCHKKAGAIREDGKKPRTYRKKARQRFLALNKRRKKPEKKIRKELRYQLRCIRRNLAYIDEYEERFGLDYLYPVELNRLNTIRIFYEQQLWMLENKTQRIPNRIVSLSQPWVRPIVRGKSKSPVEFGMKISISVVNGYAFIDTMTFDPYNEGEHEEFEKVIRKYVERFGCYPERVLADKIYRTQFNRSYCKKHGIHISGPRLGKRGKNYKELLKQELKEVGERNQVEGKFGNTKRKLGTDLIKGKTPETSGSMVCMDIFILNMEHLIRSGALCVYFLFVTIETILRLFGRKNGLETEPA